MNLEVKIIESEANNLTEALGISEERKKILNDKIYEAFENQDYHSGSIHQLSKSCNHPNELAYCSFILGRWVENCGNPLNILSSVLKAAR